jgi:hypothetical protein
MSLSSKSEVKILLMEPLPPINKVFSCVIQEENQREIFIGSMIPNTAAMMTKSAPSAPPQQNRFIKQFNRMDRPTCTHCGVAGHTIDKCYKLNGHPLDLSSQEDYLHQVPIQFFRILK